MALIRLNNQSVNPVTTLPNLASLPSGIATGKVLQQQFASFGNSSTSFTSSSFIATNITDSITPTSTSSKIFAMVEVPCWVQVNTSGSNDWWTKMDFGLYRNSSLLVESRIQSASGKSTGAYTYGHSMSMNTFIWQDSPSTTSATSYTVYLKWERLQGTGGYGTYDGRGVIILTEIEG